MKKIKWAILLVFVGCFLVGCKKEEKKIDIEELSAQILESGVFPEGMVEVEGPMLEKLYGIQEMDVTFFFGTISGGATADEVLMLQAKDKETLNGIQEQLKVRIKERKDIFESYAPEEVKKLDAAILKIQNDVLIYCISMENAKVENLLK